MSLQKLSLNLSLNLPRLGEHADWNVGAFKPHSPLEWWLYDAKTTSARTCDRCLAFEERYGAGTKGICGQWIPLVFPWHTHTLINQIRARVHPNCRCNLWWIGRREK